MTRKSLNAFILHKRPLKNTSLLIDCFSLEYGLIRCVNNGKKLRKKIPLTLFTSFWLEINLRQELSTVYQYEANEASYHLQQNALACGFYLNELLHYSVKPLEPLPEIYHLYQETLQGLSQTQHLGDIEICLRQFEIQLLSHLGFAINFQTDINSEVINPKKNYLYQKEEGFYPSESGYAGSTLQAIANNDYTNKLTRQSAKHLLRPLIDNLIDHTPLNSRGLTPKTINNSSA